jgi:hypothetical protein
MAQEYVTDVPWHVGKGENSPIVSSLKRGGSVVVGMIWRNDDAHHIVRCVNAHDRLVEALTLAREYVFSQKLKGVFGTDDDLAKIEGALRLAEGE